MKSSLSVLSILAVTLGVVPGCRSAELVAPEATEPLPVSVQQRTAGQTESVPAIHASTSAGGVTIRVTRHALCATLVSAAINRGVGEVDVVSHVYNHPAALCATTIPASMVVDYTGTVNSLPAGTYRIRVFEGEGNQPARFIGFASVTVPAPAA